MFNEEIVLATSYQTDIWEDPNPYDGSPFSGSSMSTGISLSTETLDLVLKLGDWVNELTKFSVECSEFAEQKEEEEEERKAKEEKEERSRQIEENIDLGDFE